MASPLVLPDHFLHGTLCVTTAMSVSLYVLIVPTRGLITQSSGSTRYEVIRTTATTLAHIETHNPHFWKQHIESCVSQKASATGWCAAWHLRLRVSNSIQQTQTTAAECEICFYTGAHFTSPFKGASIKQHVELPSNKWVRKHLTHGSVWSAIVCFETWYFFTACMVGSGNDSLKESFVDRTRKAFCSMSWLMDQVEFILDKLICFGPKQT